MSRPQSQIRYGNRIIQQKQETETLQKHYQSLKRARPMTGNTVERNMIMINNKKKQMVQENKFTQIQRQNRILFQKITTIMHKGTISQSVGIRDRSMNKTLNGIYRKKEMQKIEYQNAQMLKRLKQKKSNYGVAGLHRDWEKKKKVIQNMSLYPYIINDNLGAQLKRQKINDEFLVRHHSTFDSTAALTNKQLRRIRKIDGCMFLITIKFQGEKLFIIGDIKQQQNIKVIQLQRKEAESFIIDECNGNVENLFGLLRFDRQTGDLYLVGRDVGQIQKVKQFESQRRKTMSQHDTRGRKSMQRAHYTLRPMTKQLSRKNNTYTLNDNNQEELDLGGMDLTEEKIRIKSNLNMLEEQMNQEISRKIKAKQQMSERQPLSKKPKTLRDNENETETKKQSQWVRVQKREEKELQNVQINTEEDLGHQNNLEDVQNELNYEQEPNQQVC